MASTARRVKADPKPVPTADKPKTKFQFLPVQDVTSLWAALPAQPWAYFHLDDKLKRKIRKNRNLESKIRSTVRKPKWLMETWKNAKGVGLNHDFAVRFLSQDCDHDDLLRWKDKGLARPLFAVRNREGTRNAGRYHVTWELAEPVLRTPGARKAPQEKLKLIREALAWTLGADPDYAMLHTKNPFHPDHEVIWFGGAPVTLDDLARQLDIDLWIEERRKRPRGLALAKQDAGSRNNAIFEEVRHKAYRLTGRYKRTGDGDGLRAEIRGLVAEANAALGGKALDAYETDGIVRSIYRFCWNRLDWKRYDKAGGEVRMLLPKGMSLKERQAAGGRFIAGRQKAGSVVAIAAARQAIIDEGAKPTQKAVAKRAGVSLETVKRYWHTAPEASSGRCQTVSYQIGCSPGAAGDQPPPLPPSRHKAAAGPTDGPVTFDADGIPTFLYDPTAATAMHGTLAGQRRNGGVQALCLDGGVTGAVSNTPDGVPQAEAAPGALAEGPGRRVA